MAAALGRELHVGFLKVPFDDEPLLAAVREALDISGADRANRAAARIALLLPREREVLVLADGG
jgi:FixJ family two-component response regulator